jgi:YesN/AraC family two-component response regulator
MATASILWVDLRLCRARAVAVSGLEARYLVTRIQDPGKLPDATTSARHGVICFEYDYPDTAGLQALRATKTSLPHVPILMVTEQHSESLAVWAFRSGVRDYLVKPIDPFDLAARLDTLLSLGDEGSVGGARPMVRCHSAVPAEYRIRSGSEKLTQRAVNYIEAHYHEPIYIETLARICGMSASRLSRVFRDEQGEGFSRYLCRFRVLKAAALLRRPGASVTEVAMAVGFLNPSHFTHAFERYAGMLPSDHRKRAVSDRMAAAIPEGA